MKLGWLLLGWIGAVAVCAVLHGCGGRIEYTEAHEDRLSPPTFWREQYPQLSAKHLGCITLWNRNTPPGCYPAGDDGVPRQCVATANPRIVFMDPQVTCRLEVNWGCDCGNQVVESWP